MCNWNLLCNCIWSIALHGAEERQRHQLEWWRGKWKVIHSVKEEPDILCTIKWRRANLIGHTLCRNCLLKHIIEGKIEGTRRRGRRCKQLVEDLQEKKRPELEKKNSRLHSLENSLWKSLCTPHKTDYLMMNNYSYFQIIIGKLSIFATELA